MTFKQGDRVRVYNYLESWDGVICVAPPSRSSVLRSSSCIWVEGSGRSVWVHHKQCRRLIKKPKRRVWIRKRDIPLEGNIILGVEVAGNASLDLIEFVEVKKK